MIDLAESSSTGWERIRHRPVRPRRTRSRRVRVAARRSSANLSHAAAASPPSPRATSSPPQRGARVFKQPPIQRAVGAFGCGGAVDRIASRYLRRAGAVPLHVARARKGRIVLAWLAEPRRARRADRRLILADEPVIAAARAWLEADARAGESSGGRDTAPPPDGLPVVRGPSAALPAERRPRTTSCSGQAGGRWRTRWCASSRRPASCVARNSTSDGQARAAPPRRACRAPRRPASEFSGVAAERVAGTTRGDPQRRLVPPLRDRAHQRRLQGDGRLQPCSRCSRTSTCCNNVAAASTDSRRRTSATDRARQWLAEHYPGLLRGLRRSEDETRETGSRRLRLRTGRPRCPATSSAAHRPRAARGRVRSSPATRRVLCRSSARQLARPRQEMLATMVMLGMQRIVIESGRIKASMRFHIDTRSAAADGRAAARSTCRTKINGAGSFGVGPWGVSASMQNTIGYVSTQQTRPPRR